MMQGNSRIIESSQQGIHENLKAKVQTHLSSPFLRPYADHSKQAFDAFLAWYEGHKNKPLILDACCGAGDSSRKLAEQFPGHSVLGVDRSIKRLSKERRQADPENLLLLRADLMDFYRQIAAANIPVERHYILYPNPYPKPAHLGRRWHASPVFGDILKIGGTLEVRSNWKIYAEEFAEALHIAGKEYTIESIDPTDPISLFEVKYKASGQALWSVKSVLK